MAVDQVHDPDYQAFIRKVRRLLDLDLGGYKPEQMRRRLHALATRHGAPNLAVFADVMEKDVEAMNAFKNFFTINVSEFLRDASRWNELQQKVLPRLMQSGNRRGLRIWSAGCSIGAEPYSVAMLLEESAPGQQHSIMATDIDETILARAQAGRGYQESDLRQVSAERRARFFSKEPDGWAVKPALKSRIRFLKQDLLTQVPQQDLDLIVCRNVVIYFTEDAKKGLYERMYRALRPGGFLFVGGTEIVAGARDLGLGAVWTSFYEKGGYRQAGAA